MSSNYTLILFNSHEEIAPTQFSKAKFFNILGPRGGRVFKYDVPLIGTSNQKQILIAQLITEVTNKRKATAKHRKERLERERIPTHQTPSTQSTTTNEVRKSKRQYYNRVKSAISSRLSSIKFTYALFDSYGEQISNGNFTKASSFAFFTPRGRRIPPLKKYPYGFIFTHQKSNIEKLNHVLEITDLVIEEHGKKQAEKNAAKIKAEKEKKRLANKKKINDENKRRLAEHGLTDKIELDEDNLKINKKDWGISDLPYKFKISYFDSPKQTNLVLRHINLELLEHDLELINRPDQKANIKEFKSMIPLLNQLFQATFDESKKYEGVSDYIFRIKYTKKDIFGNNITLYFSNERIKKMGEHRFKESLNMLYDYWIEKFYTNENAYYKTAFARDIKIQGVEVTETVFQVSKDVYRSAVQ